MFSPLRHAGLLPLTPPQVDYNPLAELQKWEDIQRKEDASFASMGRRFLGDALLHCCTAAHWDQFLLFCLHCLHASSSLHFSSVTPFARQARLCSEGNSPTRCHQPTGPRVGQGRQAAACRCDDKLLACVCVTMWLQCNNVR